MPPQLLRTTRAQANQDELNLKKAMGLSKALKQQVALPKQARRGRPRRRAASISSEESADGDVEEDSEGSEDSEDGTDEDNQSDEDEPVSFAPAHVPTGHETGLLSVGYASELPTLLDDEVSLFDNMNSDDDNDDDIYRKVEEISDYDDEEDERQDEDELAAVWEAEAEQDPDLILDQLDENSVYGYGADFDSGEEFVAFTSESDSPPEVELKRRVHFSTEDIFPRFTTESLSPVLTRTLLPSALPHLDISVAQGLASASADAARANADPEDEDPYDTDATADNLPPEAHNAIPITPSHAVNDKQASPALSLSPSPKRKKSKKQKNKTPRSKGPRVGTFIVDQDKPWGILDASGKRVVMLPAPDSQRHDWLDAKLRRDYDDPGDATLGQLLDESDGSVTSSQDVMETTMEAKADIMLAGLNSNGNNAGPAGQATGPSEAFYPPAGYQVAGDYLISQEELTQTFSDSDEGDIPMDIRNFISFDDEPSDEEDSPTSPAVVINMPPVSELPGYAVNDEFPHLNNRNVTAFRRNADPAQAVLNTTPNFSNFSQSEASNPRPLTPKTSRKRKASNLPYQSPVYQGVTPVQRHVWHPTKRLKTTPRVDDAK